MTVWEWDWFYVLYTSYCEIHCRHDYMGRRLVLSIIINLIPLSIPYCKITWSTTNHMSLIWTPAQCIQFTTGIWLVVGHIIFIEVLLATTLLLNVYLVIVGVVALVRNIIIMYLNGFVHACTYNIILVTEDVKSNRLYMYYMYNCHRWVSSPSRSKWCTCYNETFKYYQ